MTRDQGHTRTHARYAADSEAAQQACAEVWSLGDISFAVPLALKTLISSPPPQSSSTTDPSAPGQDPEVAAPTSQQTSPTVAPAQKTDLTATVAVNMLMRAATRPIMPHIPAGNASTSTTHSQQAADGFTSKGNSAAHPATTLPDLQSSAAATWAQAFARIVLTVPTFVTHLVPPTRAQLTDAKVISALLTALHRLAQPGVALDKGSAASPGGRTRQALEVPMLQGTGDALVALSNTVQLLAGSPITKAAAKVGYNG